jgi:hypothetical protein
VEASLINSSSKWLVLLIASILAIAYQSKDSTDNLPQSEQDSPQAHKSANVFDWTADQIHVIHVSLTGSRALMIKRTERQEWSADIKVDAGLWKNFDVNVFLGTLSRAREERQYGPATEGGKYGFDHAVVLRLETQNAKQAAAEIKIGDLAPDGLSRYVLITGKDAIISIPNYHVKELLRLYSSAGS